MNDFVGTQLTGWDAATFRTASGDPTMRSTVMAATILESTPDWDRLRARVERLTLMVPSLRMRPLFGVLGVSAPRLAIDPDFDLDVHLHRYRVPDGTGWQALLDDARRMSLTDFDRNRALWEAVLVEGLPDGRAAFVLKLHHSIADGQATVMMGLALFEFGPEPDPNEAPAPEPPPADDVGLRDVTAANIADSVHKATEVASSLVRGAFGFAKGTVTEPRRTWGAALTTMTSIGRVAAVPDGPLSPVMVGRGTTYSFAAMDMPFPPIRAAAKERGLSVNDAFLAAVAEGMDLYHRRHGVVVEELRINVPISLRGDAGDRSGKSSNAVAIARFPIGVAGLSPDEHMAQAHDLVEHWREEPAIRMADPLAEVSWVVPVPMIAQAAQASDVTTSNVPGPPLPLYLAGVHVDAVYPLVATIGAAVNITMVTYDGTAFFGISADDRAVSDLPALVADLAAGLATVTGDTPTTRPQAPAGESD
jgi:WS/DGAT/MGAT family acyltransferase